LKFINDINFQVETFADCSSPIIYIHNLPDGCTSEQLRDKFREFGSTVVRDVFIYDGVGRILLKHPALLKYLFMKDVEVDIFVFCFNFYSIVNC